MIRVATGVTRTLLATLFLCVYIVRVPLLCFAVADASLFSTQPSPRFAAVGGIGVDERVEPYPAVRVYAYTPRNAFNPSTSSYSDRITRALEAQAYRSEALDLKNMHSRLLQVQRRQLGRIMDASEKRS